MSKYNVLDISTYVINYCIEHKIFISNFKLQSLLYLIQGQFLLELNQPAFNDQIEAWSFGPIVPVVYRKYKKYAAESIPYVDEYYRYTDIDQEDRVIIDLLLEESKFISSASLRNFICESSVWQNAYHADRIISKESIKEFFEQGNTDE